SMSFTIWDPTKLVTIPDTAKIRSWDYTRDLPVFTGFVQTQSPVPGYGGAGRDIDVTCYGVESLLDQIIIPRISTVAGDDFDGTNIHEFQFLQRLGQYLPLRAARTEPGSTFTSSLTNPIQDFGGYFSGLFLTPFVIEGLSVRQTFETWVAAASWSNITDPFGYAVALTVDFWENLRGFWWGRGVAAATYPTDYDTLVVDEATAGTAAAALRWTRDSSPGQIISAVYVKGGNAAGTGWVVGDTTKGRSEAYISDSTITTYEARQAAGQAELGRKGTGSGRGSITIENFTPINAHSGGELTITNSALGWSAKSFVISQIDKTFNKSGTQNWTVTFFDVDDVPAAGRRSLARRLRSVTRTLS
ncbi:MAG TPA: hypothetical protein VGQ89_14730, partial [Candidatus Limnocylindrales bacterium]|nr:hypothetical protein [Candidatus Limnocylindrales bacterium]